MVDHVSVTEGSGRDVATERISGVDYQLIKLLVGESGVATHVSGATPLPVSAAALPLPSGAATEAKQDDIITAIGAIPAGGGGGDVNVTASVLPIGAATEAKQDDIIAALGSPMQAGGAVTISGSVGVTGTFWQATQPVSLDSSVAVTGTFWQATQPVSAAALPLPTGAATETKQDDIIAAIEAIPAGGGGGGGDVSVIDSVLPTGAATAANQDSIISALGSPLQAGGAVTVSGDVAVTGTFWQTIQPVSAASLPLPSGAATEAKQDDIIAAIEAIPSGGGGGGGDVSVIDSVLPTGAATAANQDSIIAALGSVPVTGTFWQTTQPVSAASLPLPSGAATEAKQPALGTAGSASVDVLTVQGAAAMTALKVDGSGVTQPVSGTVAVTGTFWQATQPVSGTVTANAGTNLNTSALAIETGGNLAGIVSRIGDVETSPTANTLLDRVKALMTGIVLAAGSAIIGKVDHSTTGIGHGSKAVTTAGTALALATTTAAKWVIVQARTNNTGIIAVGGSGVVATAASGTGVSLAAGDSITLPIDDLADVFVDATVSGESVRFTYGT